MTSTSKTSTTQKTPFTKFQLLITLVFRILDSEQQPTSDFNPTPIARLYPNVRGCGYPPELDCDEFYSKYGISESSDVDYLLSSIDQESKNKNPPNFPCWVSTMDPSIAMTSLNLDRAKHEVIYSLIPLFVFIVFVLYAFCRLGVFSICNPLKMLPKAADNKVTLPSMTPMKLFEYKRSSILGNRTRNV